MIYDFNVLFYLWLVQKYQVKSKYSEKNCNKMFYLNHVYDQTYSLFKKKKKKNLAFLSNFSRNVL